MEALEHARRAGDFTSSAQEKKFTRDEMVELGYDTYIVPADVIGAASCGSFARAGLKDEKLRRPLEELKKWNRRSAEDSLATTYLFYWAKTYKAAQGDAKYARFVVL